MPVWDKKGGNVSITSIDKMSIMSMHVIQNTSVSIIENFGTAELNASITTVDEGTGILSEMEHPVVFLVLLLISAVTFLGNLMVIVAVICYRQLHTPTNFLILSLAGSDTLMGSLVMPFGAVAEGMDGKWLFGNRWCEGWISMDVLCSTASILNLCIISLERYWAITDPINYPAKMTSKKVGRYIAGVWFCSSLISFPAIVWWRATQEGPALKTQCLFTEDIGYRIFSSIISFYAPACFMLFAYYKIYKEAKRHTKSLVNGRMILKEGSIRMHRGGTSNYQMEKLYGDGKVDIQHISNNGKLNCESTVLNDINKDTNFRGIMAKKISKFAKEKKAAKTLGTVMGVFIICWLPFFVINILSVVWPYGIPVKLFQIVTWLGWLNSIMNPFIYACCSKDLRRAFGRVLQCQQLKRLSLCVHCVKSSCTLNSKSGNVCQNDRMIKSRRNTKNDSTVCIEISSQGEGTDSKSPVLPNCSGFGNRSDAKKKPFSQCSNTNLFVSLYEIPPPNFKDDPQSRAEKLF